MPRKISNEELSALDPKAHRELMQLEGLAEVVDVEVDGARYCAVARFTGDDGEHVTLHYGPDTGLEWLQF